MSLFNKAALSFFAAGAVVLGNMSVAHADWIGMQTCPTFVGTGEEIEAEEWNADSNRATCMALINGPLPDAIVQELVWGTVETGGTGGLDGLDGPAVENFDYMMVLYEEGSLTPAEEQLLHDTIAAAAAYVLPDGSTCGTNRETQTVASAPGTVYGSGGPSLPGAPGCWAAGMGEGGEDDPIFK